MIATITPRNGLLFRKRGTPNRPRKTASRSEKGLKPRSLRRRVAVHKFKYTTFPSLAATVWVSQIKLTLPVAPRTRTLGHQRQPLRRLRLSLTRVAERLRLHPGSRAVGESYPRLAAHPCGAADSSTARQAQGPAQHPGHVRPRW